MGWVPFKEQCSDAKNPRQRFGLVYFSRRCCGFPAFSLRADGRLPSVVPVSLLSISIFCCACLALEILSPWVCFPFWFTEHKHLNSTGLSFHPDMRTSSSRTTCWKTQTTLTVEHDGRSIQSLQDVVSLWVPLF